MFNVSAETSLKTVATPDILYDTLKEFWAKSRAVCTGEKSVKSYDSFLDTMGYRNLLIPFSPTMSQAQYDFYRAEAELPGITSQFARMLVGGLLRKKPVITLPEGLPEEASNWISEEFGQDDSNLVAFLDDALWEEVQTSRAWIYVDHPSVEDIDEMSVEDRKKLKPYPVLWDAEFVIATRVRTDAFGKTLLDRVVTKGFVESYEENEWHPDYVETVWVHELDKKGFYQIRVFERVDKTNQITISGTQKQSTHDRVKFEEKKVIKDFLVNGERLNFIPAWPLNGNIEPVEPMLINIIDKEVALYNKISRRNHLLYGACTYTPWVKTNMGEEAFNDMVAQGLGTWMRLAPEDDIGVLRAPSDSLADMDRSILNSIEEMAKLGIRMLSPETDQSGVALQLRNASQTAQLGSLNNKVSNTMSQIIAFMINWRYDLDIRPQDVQFSLSADFNPLPLGADWLRLVSEWYKEGLIPRSIWLEILKHNDLIPPDYDDEEGLKEITEKMDILMSKTEEDYALKYANTPVKE
jgi:hypothetical protein